MDLLKGRAYSIFVTELANHLTKADTFFFSGKSPGVDELKLASISFHTIKGGAGFFGLDQIARIAGELETLLQAPELNLVSELEKIRGQIAQLKDLSKTIPAPVKETK